MSSLNKSFITDDGEVREDLTDKELDVLFSKAKHLSDLPRSLQTKLRAVGRPVADNPKVSTTIRFDAEVLEYFKESGKGWQTRINKVLRDYIAAHE